MLRRVAECCVAAPLRIAFDVNRSLTITVMDIAVCGEKCADVITICVVAVQTG